MQCDAGGNRTAEGRTYIGSPRVLKGKSEFDRVFREGRRRSGRSVSLVYRLRDDGGLRAAFIAPKAIGGAVARNRQRRRLREACRGLWPDIGDSPADVVFIAQPEATQVRFADLAAEMEELLRRAGILVRKRRAPG